MRIAIVDDKREDRENLHTMVEQYCETRGVKAETICFASGDELLEAFRPGYFQCVFLDIYMDGTDGMETARKICRLDPSCRLIFCTVSISHAVASYEVRAAWYLTKPFSARRLADALDTALSDMLRHGRSLTVHIKGKEVSVRLSDVYFMDCSSRKTRLHLRMRTLEVDELAGDLMRELTADDRFLVCNRNTVVNMDHIDLAEEGDFLMKNGSRVPLRQRGRAPLKKAFLAWSLRELRREERL